MGDLQGAYRQGFKRPVLYAPTGWGKSTVLSVMLKKSIKNTLILANRYELIDQLSESLAKQGIDHGKIMPGIKPMDRQIQVGMQQTVSLRTRQPFDWVISDECQFCMAQGWESLLRDYPDAFHLGLSGTPTRLDGRGLGGFFDVLVQAPSIRQLTAMGRIVPCRIFRPESNKQAVVGDAIAEWRRVAQGRRTIVFCPSVRQAELDAAAFRAAGIRAENIDGKMDRGLRRERVLAFKRGDLDMLMNVDLLIAGFDCPSVSCIIFRRRTESLAFYLQAIGRGIRTDDGKTDCILIDQVGNSYIHGMPDEDREWTLEGRNTIPGGEKPIQVQRCPDCFAVDRPRPICGECGYVFSAEGNGKQIKIEAGELSEVDKAAANADVERIRNTPLPQLLTPGMSYRDLQVIQKARGFKPGWTYYTFKQLGGTFR